MSVIANQMTSQKEFRLLIFNLLFGNYKNKKNDWVTLDELYKLAEDFFSSRWDSGRWERDFAQSAPSNTEPSWKRNLRNCLQYEKDNYDLLEGRDKKYRIKTSIPYIGMKVRFQRDLYDLGLHNFTDNGIAGYGGGKPAKSIIVNIGGEYPDDKIDGNTLIYTGEGGKNRGDKVHTKDQEMKRGNLALRRNQIQGVPLDVYRKSKTEPLEYLGTFSVSNISEGKRNNKKIYLFHLNSNQLGSEEKTDTPPPERKPQLSNRIVRNTKISQEIKNLYNNKCQICKTVIQIDYENTYSEGAHIRPLSENGIDEKENLLCLCANCHVILDYGGLYFKNNFEVIRIIDSKSLGYLEIKHNISMKNLIYLRKKLGVDF